MFHSSCTQNANYNSLSSYLNFIFAGSVVLVLPFQVRYGKYVISKLHDFKNIVEILFTKEETFLPFYSSSFSVKFSIVIKKYKIRMSLRAN